MVTCQVEEVLDLSHPCALARRHVSETLRTWDCAGIEEDAALLVSELVGNVIRHGDDTTRIRLLIRQLADRVRVEVTDRSDAAPRLRRATAEDVGGRGLVLVEAIALDWGWDPSPPGKRVWFEIAC